MLDIVASDAPEESSVEEEPPLSVTSSPSTSPRTWVLRKAGKSKGLLWSDHFELSLIDALGDI
jgi:hypothetical protein